MCQCPLSLATMPRRPAARRESSTTDRVPTTPAGNLAKATRQPSKICRLLAATGPATKAIISAAP
jgi:hypothetical protein